jgi:exonuclease VII large subunit
MLNLQLELDILKSILERERLSDSVAEKRASHPSNELKVANEKCLLICNQCEDVKNELKHAKPIIEALESQQCLSISQTDELRDSNNQYVELLRKHEEEISILKKQLANHLEGVDEKTSCPCHDLKDWPLPHSERTRILPCKEVVDKHSITKRWSNT